MTNENNTKTKYLIKSLNHLCGASQLYGHKAIKRG